MSTTTNLNDKQKKWITNFKRWHKRCGNGEFEILVNPTGIGNVIKIKCPNCGKVKDITDVDSW